MTDREPPIHHIGKRYSAWQNRADRFTVGDIVLISSPLVILLTGPAWLPWIF
ncbi:hypothetical protein [Microbacterium schleiferi]|uniref:hypothetical protein n=1 Tax=Microbacterium schleiferi TaxID=69362 RepID=UPI001D17A07B|nr:hypothetical protein [Microbacterium schleiferi]MCC4266235.1 hypothetical protein [Microbacterium schleiferi]